MPGGSLVILEDFFSLGLAHFYPRTGHTFDSKVSWAVFGFFLGHLGGEGRCLHILRSKERVKLINLGLSILDKFSSIWLVGFHLFLFLFDRVKFYQFDLGHLLLLVELFVHVNFKGLNFSQPFFIIIKKMISFNIGLLFVHRV